jgi:hypothetical protein
LAISNIAKGQACAGSWAVQRPITSGCISGQWVGQISNNPAGCPVNPTYMAIETNTYTFAIPVSTFFIDFNGFDGQAHCARMEIKVNGLFYPLTMANLSDFPSGTSCTGSFSTLVVTPDGYITCSDITTSQGRIMITNVNASSVTVSTNDGRGTAFTSPFGCTTIPLKLESFTGNASSACHVILNWKTGIEFNVKNIEIQRSEDGNVFKKVGAVNPKGSNSRYSFITANISGAFFRLKINDFDGYYEYSHILSIKSDCKNIAYQVMPNPASNLIEIISLKKDDKVFVFDLLGRKVLTFNSSQNNNKFDIQKLLPGMYILQVISDSLIKANMKIIKN